LLGHFQTSSSSIPYRGYAKGARGQAPVSTDQGATLQTSPSRPNGA
jgi:hypothetical protein